MITLIILAAAFILQSYYLLTDYHPLLIVSLIVTMLVMAGVAIGLQTDKARKVK